MKNSMSNHSSSKNGMTIIEVLTAMVVAMIGVFGIMILIPFAIKQSETGLDLDSANLTARNAVEVFELNGFERLVETEVHFDGDSVTPPDVILNLPLWFAWGDPALVDDTSTTTVDERVVRVGFPNDSTVPYDQPGIDVYSIDPLSVAFKFNLDGGATPYYGQFPPVESLLLSTAAPNNLELEPSAPNYTMYDPIADDDVDWFPHIPEANVALYDQVTGNAVPFGTEEAGRMFRSTDDLEFGEFDLGPADLAAVGATDNELLPPRMYFDQGTSGGLRRQSRGEISWQMIVAPVKDKNDFVFNTQATPNFGSNWYINSGGWKFRQHTLVWENRVLDPAVAVMPVARVTEVNRGIVRGIQATGGSISLGTVANPLEVRDVRKNDWIMLVNRNRSLNPSVRAGDSPPYQELGFEKQVEFYRVVDSYFDSINGTSRIALDGPAFDYGPGPGADERTTYAVHLVNFDAAAFALGEAQRIGQVINVYERTFKPKGSSVWNR